MALDKHKIVPVKDQSGRIIGSAAIVPEEDHEVAILNITDPAAIRYFNAALELRYTLTVDPPHSIQLVAKMPDLTQV